MARKRLGLTRFARPENELKVLVRQPDGEEAWPAGCRVLNPPLEAKDIRVEIEGPVLVANEHGRVGNFFQHGSSSSVGGLYWYDHPRRPNVTEVDRTNMARSRHSIACAAFTRSRASENLSMTPTGDSTTFDASLPKRSIRRDRQMAAECHSASSTSFSERCLTREDCFTAVSHEES
jgi:hypothetical protein